MTKALASRICRVAMTLCVTLVPLAGATADDSYVKPLAVVEGWSVVHGAYGFYKGKCSLIKDMESGRNPQLQVHPDADNSGSIAAMLVNLDVIRAGLILKYNDPKADITRVTTSLDGGAPEPIQMPEDSGWSLVYAHRGNDLLTAREMVVLIYFALSNKSTGHFEVHYPLRGLAKVANWFEKETCA